MCAFRTAGRTVPATTRTLRGALLRHELLHVNRTSALTSDFVSVGKTTSKHTDSRHKENTETQHSQSSQVTTPKPGSSGVRPAPLPGGVSSAPRPCGSRPWAPGWAGPQQCRWPKFLQSRLGRAASPFPTPLGSPFNPEPFGTVSAKTRVKPPGTPPLLALESAGPRPGRHVHLSSDPSR